MADEQQPDDMPEEIARMFEEDMEPRTAPEAFDLDDTPPEVQQTWGNDNAEGVSDAVDNAEGVSDAVDNAEGVSDAVAARQPAAMGAPPEVQQEMDEAAFDLTGIEAQPEDSPEDRPKFFEPPEIQDHPQTAEFRMEQLPPEAMHTMAKLAAMAQPRPVTPQQRRVQARSAARAQSRRSRMGQQPPALQSESAEDIWGDMVGGDDPYGEQSFDDFTPPEVAGAAGMGGGNGDKQGGGMEKLVQVGDRILAAIEKIEAKMESLDQAMQQVAESMQDTSARWG